MYINYRCKKVCECTACLLFVSRYKYKLFWEKLSYSCLSVRAYMQKDNTKHILISVICTAQIWRRLSDVTTTWWSFKESKFHKAESILQKSFLQEKERFDGVNTDIIGGKYAVQMNCIQWGKFLQCDWELFWVWTIANMKMARGKMSEYFCYQRLCKTAWFWWRNIVLPFKWKLF